MTSCAHWDRPDTTDDHSRQPILADEIQTFKALITVHKVLQEGHPIVLKEAQSNTSWLESLSRGSTDGAGARGYAPLISEYIYYLMAKLAFHRQHPEFNGTTLQRKWCGGRLTPGRHFRVRGVHQLEVHQRSQRGLRDD